MGRVTDHESFIVRIKQLICRELPLENAPDLRWGKKYSSMIRALCYRGYNSLVAHWKLRHFSFFDPWPSMTARIMPRSFVEAKILHIDIKRSMFHFPSSAVEPLRQISAALRRMNETDLLAFDVIDSICTWVCPAHFSCFSAVLQLFSCTLGIACCS